MKLLPRLSFGIGGRFCDDAAAILDAFARLAAEGTVVAPVWGSVEAARWATSARAWPHPWFVDAGRIRPTGVCSGESAGDFVTFDLAAAIGRPAAAADIRAFVARHPALGKPLAVPGITKVIRMSEDVLAATARKYIAACREAGALWRRARRSVGNNVVIEVSLHAAAAPQPPGDLLVILSLLTEEEIPLQAIAPRFVSRGSPAAEDGHDEARFEQELSDDIAICAFAAARFGLPAALKMSLSSVGDTANLFPVIRRTLARTGAGVHARLDDTARLEEPVGESLYTHHLRPLFGACDPQQPVASHGLRSAPERC